MSVQSHDMRPMRAEMPEKYLAKSSEHQLPIQAALTVQADALNDLETSMERLFDTLQPLFGAELPMAPGSNDVQVSHGEVDGQANDNTARIRRLTRGLHTFADRLRG